MGMPRPPVWPPVPHFVCGDPRAERLPLRVVFVPSDPGRSLRALHTRFLGESQTTPRSHVQGDDIRRSSRSMSPPELQEHDPKTIQDLRPPSAVRRPLLASSARTAWTSTPLRSGQAASRLGLHPSLSFLRGPTLLIAGFLIFAMRRRRRRPAAAAASAARAPNATSPPLARAHHTSPRPLPASRCLIDSKRSSLPQNRDNYPVPLSSADDPPRASSCPGPPGGGPLHEATSARCRRSAAQGPHSRIFSISASTISHREWSGGVVSSRVAFTCDSPRPVPSLVLPSQARILDSSSIFIESSTRSAARAAAAPSLGGHYERRADAQNQS